MQLSQTTLLASILFFLSFAGATPLTSKRSPGGFLSLPVKRYQPETNDLHPLIVAEQLANRALQRLARMTGNPAIPREVLERNLMRRVLEVEGQAGLEKRFNRRSLEDTVVLDKRSNLYDGPTSLDNSLAAGDGNSVTKANPVTAKNSLGLDIEGLDIAYLATIQIGSPARDFSILMDSGSSDFWVGSENCTTKKEVGCGNHVFLGNSSSRSFVDKGVPWSIDYVSGSVSGTIVEDDVSIAGLELPGLSFGVANVETLEFSNAGFDGLMGLGGSGLSNQNNPIPVEVLAQAGLISDSIVSYKIGRSSDKENDGEISFGGLDPTKFDPKTLITVKNVNPDKFWAATLEDVQIDGQSLGLRTTAVLDTGTTLSLIPEGDARTIHSRIPGSRFDQKQGFFAIPCNTTTEVSFTFGGRSFAIDPRDLSFVPSGNIGECLSGLKPSSPKQFSSSEWLLGDVFLKNAYFSTNFRTNTIGLAKLV